MENKGFAFRCGAFLYYYTKGKDGEALVYPLVKTKDMGILSLVTGGEARPLNSIPPRKYWEILPQFKLGWFWGETKMRLSPILYDWEHIPEWSKLSIVKSLDDYFKEVNRYKGTGRLFTTIEGIGIVYSEGNEVHFYRFSAMMEGLLC